MPANSDDLKYCRWAVEVADKQAEWARAKRINGMSTATDAEIAAYREGIRQGYLNAIADIRLHGGKL